MAGKHRRTLRECLFPPELLAIETAARTGAAAAGGSLVDDTTIDLYLNIAEGCWRARHPLTEIRKAYEAEGLDVCPMGDQDGKTLLPGFYRGIGCDGNGTCPSSCPFMPKGNAQGPCYGAGYRTRQHAKRAPASVEAAVAAFIACCYVACRRDRHPGRLFITGDCCRDGVRDDLLIDGLAAAGRRLAARLRLSGPVGYGYSQLQEQGLYERLRGSHVAMLRSSWIGPGGATVWPIEHLSTLKERHPGTTFVPCAHHTRGIPCRVCDLCHRAPERGHCVVLQPTGTHRKRITAALLADVN